MRIYLLKYLALRALRAVIYPFSGLLYPTLEFCAGERRLNSTRRHLHVSRRYTHPLRPVYTRFASVMSVIRWLVVQEVCSRFEFARPNAHANEHPIVIMLLSTRIIFSTYSFN